MSWDDGPIPAKVEIATRVLEALSAGDSFTDAELSLLDKAVGIVEAFLDGEDVDE